MAGNQRQVKNKMKDKNEDWKPEIGKPAWVLDPRHSRVIEIEVVEVLRARPMIGYRDVVRITHPRSYGTWSEGWHKCFPTSDAALASIEVVYLEGKEVVITRADGEFVKASIVEGLLAAKDRELLEAKKGFEGTISEVLQVISKRFSVLENPHAVQAFLADASGKGLPWVKPIPIWTDAEREAAMASQGFYNIDSIPEGFDLSKVRALYTKLDKSAASGESPTKEDNRDGSYTN